MLHQWRQYTTVSYLHEYIRTRFPHVLFRLPRLKPVKYEVPVKAPHLYEVWLSCGEGRVVDGLNERAYRRVRIEGDTLKERF